MSMVRGPLSLPPDAEGADLLAALEPYLWLMNITPLRYYPAAPKAPVDWWEVEGIVKAQGEPPSQPPSFRDRDDVQLRADAIRGHLFGVAQTAICAAEDAGYDHVRHPHIDLGGNLFTDPGTGLQVPRSECTLRMWLRKAEPRAGTARHGPRGGVTAR